MGSTFITARVAGSVQGNLGNVSVAVVQAWVGWVGRRGKGVQDFHEAARDGVKGVYGYG